MNDRVVLSMITYNSIGRLSPSVFMEVLASSLRIPYNTMILVDDSEDGLTRDFVKRFAEANGKELVAVASRLPRNVSKPTRATARQTAIDIFFENTRGEWLFFLDDDAVLNPRWWDEAVQYVNDGNVGEIWGLNWDASPERAKFLSMIGVDYEEWLIRAFMRRGGCHDTLYRRKAIEGVVIPPELHVYEDAWLHHYVRCHGWESRIVRAGIKHYSPSLPSRLREIKEKWGRALDFAVRYGIVEYESMEGFMREKSRLKAYLSLCRPMLGIPLMFATLTRVYGLKTALKETLVRQYAKLWQRYTVIKTLDRLRRDGREIPSICEAIKTYVSAHSLKKVVDVQEALSPKLNLY
jgi:cellulose synthase/poly-beta-1,6-N-acetylglucosamine synthase-like glycosyltransferase